MVKEKKNNWYARLTIVFLLLLCFAGMLAFRSGIFAVPSFTRSTPHIVLCDEVAIRGMVKEADLKLSNHEVRKINRAFTRHGKLFEKMDLQVDMADQFDKAEITDKTKLDMIMSLQSDVDLTVQSWRETIARAEFTPFVVRWLRRAAAELVRFQECEEFDNRNISKLYL